MAVGVPRADESHKGAPEAVAAATFAIALRLLCNWWMDPVMCCRKQHSKQKDSEEKRRKPCFHLPN